MVSGGRRGGFFVSFAKLINITTWASLYWRETFSGVCGPGCCFFTHWACAEVANGRLCKKKYTKQAMNHETSMPTSSKRWRHARSICTSTNISGSRWAYSLKHVVALWALHWACAQTASNGLYTLIKYINSEWWDCTLCTYVTNSAGVDLTTPALEWGVVEDKQDMSTWALEWGSNWRLVGLLYLSPEVRSCWCYQMRWMSWMERSSSAGVVRRGCSSHLHSWYTVIHNS